MEYGPPPPDPAKGIGGYNSSMPHKGSIGFAEDSIPDSPLDEAISVRPVNYNNLILPSGMSGSYNTIPQNTELPECVMSTEEQTTPQHDSGQESNEEVEDHSDSEKPPDSRDWSSSESSGDDESESSSSSSSSSSSDDDSDEEEDQEEEEEGEENENNDDGDVTQDATNVITGGQNVLSGKERPPPSQPQDIPGWPQSLQEPSEEFWGNESEDAVNAEEDSSSTDSETESINDDASEKDFSNNDNASEKDFEDPVPASVSPVKPSKAAPSESVLCFDEYGNLTTYCPPPPPPPAPPTPPPPPPPRPPPPPHSHPPKLNFDKISNQDFLDAAETLESEMSDSFNSYSKKVEPKEVPSISSSNVKPPKVKPSSKHLENSELDDLSEAELKQAFKEDFSTAATSRYGRTRKRKTEGDFFFGTINFNELRKITSSTSPKKSKGCTGNIKIPSPEQKTKVSKTESKSKGKMEEAKDNNMIHNGPSNCSEVPVDANMKNDVDATKPTNELPSAVKSDNELVQNSLSSKVKASRGDDGISEGNNLEVREAEAVPHTVPQKIERQKLSPKAKVSQKKDSQKKESKSEVPVRSKPGVLLEPMKKELVSTSLEDDVAKIKQAQMQKRKRLSLPSRRSELSLLKGSDAPVSVDSERMLRRRSDVWKIKNSLQPQKPPTPRSRRKKNSDVPVSEEKDKETTSNSLSEIVTKNDISIKDGNSASLETIKTETQSEVPAKVPTRRLRSSQDTSSTLEKESSKPNDTLPEISSDVKSVGSPNLHKSATLPKDEKAISQLLTPSPRRKGTQALAATPPASSLKEEESGSVTKFGRTVRKPDLMDVSAEHKKQKIKSKEVCSSSILETPEQLNIDYSALEKEHPCEFMVGDVVWVLIKGSPLWPAMVSYHPDIGEFTKFSVKQLWNGKISCSRSYFVQFFNDNGQTYWIAPSSVLPFSGFDKLKTYLGDLKSKYRQLKGTSKLQAEGLLKTIPHIKKLNPNESSADPSAHKHKRWQHAIEEGEDAMALDRYERLQKYALKMDKEEVKGKTQVKKPSEKNAKRTSSAIKKVKIGRPRKRESRVKSLQSVKSSDEVMSTDGEFSGFDENYSSDENRNVSNLISEISSGHKESFAQYAAKHLQKFILENPNISETAARTKLRWRWKKLKNSRANRKAKLLGKRETKGVENAESTSLKRKHRNSVERDGVAEDSEATAPKRKRTDESKDGQKGVYRVVRNEKVCYMCESASTENGADMVRCKGVCYGIFHLSCVGLPSVPKSDFKCVECQTGEHQCFICKINTGIRQRCTVSFCGKFYHEDCVQKWPQVSKNRHQEKFVCPRHICHMCAANADDMNDPVARNPQFTRCLKCPTTYHTGEECIAAGSEEISQHHHICTKHLKKQKTNMHHVNVSWCFCCSKGGSLLLCDQCPAAFHAECMKITAPEGSYVCEDCENGKFPVYGDVVWVKLGQYRWWPGQVLHPRYIPDNIENLPHQQGMFCVHFFGSNDYYWVTRGRAFHYQEGDKGSKAASSKTLEMQFQKAISEALEAYREQKQRKAQLEVVRSGKGKLKPPPYVKIDSNRPVGNVRLNKLDLGSVNRCECDPFQENPCGSDEKCLNRMLMFECVREVCGAGDKCGNQRFQKRRYANVTSFRTDERGWGLKTLEDVKKGDFVIEYVGELIDDEEFHRRIEEMHKVKEENYYFLTIDKDIMIDAGPKGNLARFMNHSCEPNCETQKWTVGGDTRVGLFALYDIPGGSELTFNYNLQCVGTDKKKCNCGATNCSGFIGAKVQKNDCNGPKREKLAKRKRKRKPAKISEDECYRCGGAGDLILCDVVDCPKGYHLQCLSLEKLPKGKWICPWHHCDECGQRSFRPHRCDYCPNSFCRAHVSENIQHVPGVGNVCQDHATEDLQTLRSQMEAKAAGQEMTMYNGGWNSSNTLDASAVDHIQFPNLQNNGFHDAVPSYCENSNASDSSSSTFNENTHSLMVSKSGNKQDPTNLNTSAIVPLGMKGKNCRSKKMARIREGHENNASVINVSSDASCLSVSSSKANRHAKNVMFKNGIRSRRSASETLAV